MWQIIDHPPQPFGECTLCKRHSCGEYTDENGIKRHKWVHTPLEMDKGGNLVIGYKCIENMADNLAITKKVVEKVVEVPPSDEQILHVFRQVVANNPMLDFAYQVERYEDAIKEQPKRNRKGAAK